MCPIHFSQIHPRAFAYPTDARATSAFESIPLLPDLLKKIAQLGIEERFRAHHMHSSVQVGPRQLPSIWNMVHGVAERLGITPPNVYVTRNGEANAFAFGRHKHSIVLTSKLVDMMDEQELRGIIAHEMGHILCQHMLYMDVGLALASNALPKFTKILPAVEESIAGLFFAWFRAAEYSADRAALLILEDADPLARALCRLAGLPRRYEGEFDLQLFALQTESYQEEATWWSKLVTLDMGTFATHPEPAKRVKAALDWAGSDEYKTILSGRYLTRFEVEAQERIQIEGVRSCPLCRNPVGQIAICGYCKLPQDGQRQHRCRNGHINGIDWRYCKACGDEIRQDARHIESLAN